MPLDLYDEIPSNSIDYAIMERAADIAMVPAGFRWNDLGSWQSLLDASALADKNGNVVVGDVVAIDCENSYLRSDGRLLSAIGHEGRRYRVDPRRHLRRSGEPQPERQEDRRAARKIAAGWRPSSRRRMTASSSAAPGASASRHWLFDETLPLWSTAGVDERSWRLPRGARLRRRAAEEAEAHAHHGAADLCLRRRQGARLGPVRPTASSSTASPSWPARAAPTARRLRAHAECRRLRRRPGRGRLRPFLRALGAGPCASGRQRRALALGEETFALPRHPSRGRPPDAASWRRRKARACAAPTRICICSRRSSPGIR